MKCIDIHLCLCLCHVHIYIYISMYLWLQGHGWLGFGWGCSPFLFRTLLMNLPSLLTLLFYGMAAWLHMATRHDMTVHSLISALGHWPTTPESFWRVPSTNKQFKWIPGSGYMCPGTVSSIFIYYIYLHILVYTHIEVSLKLGPTSQASDSSQASCRCSADGNIYSGVPLIVLVGSLDKFKSTFSLPWLKLSKGIHMVAAEMFLTWQKKIPNAALKEAPSILSMQPSFRNPSKRFKKAVWHRYYSKYTKMYQLLLLLMDKILHHQGW